MARGKPTRIGRNLSQVDIPRDAAPTKAVASLVAPAVAEPLGGGRTWWAHLACTRINITPTILHKKMEEQLVLGASLRFSALRRVWRSQQKTAVSGAREDPMSSGDVVKRPWCRCEKVKRRAAIAEPSLS